ncbi:MAG: nicotinate-nucleotide diphosphorylase (carboxylating), partial [Proteobacteria bacterium]|nr:nicotinate-nucleotide diphosphorylase (carboxylating) [Pseudomonadota bacterium]
SGIAELTSHYVRELEGTKTTLIDTRKTLPGLRYPDKYAVLCGGAHNHRKNLVEMLMLKDNHIDRTGSITKAVAMCRAAYDPCPPIEVECRNEEEIREAVACKVQRVMFDNMQPDAILRGLVLVPDEIETELSGNVSLENIRSLAELGPNFISVGRLTHSASASDFSMQILT